jgi:sugar phosphate isomerase/epimerase
MDFNRFTEAHADRFIAPIEFQMQLISRLSINQYTLKNLTIPQLLEDCAAEQIHFVALWREKVAQAGLGEVVRLLSDTGIKVSSLCRGGFFPASTLDQQSKNLDENYRAVDEAAAIAAEILVLVCGGIVNHDIDRSRAMVVEGIARLLPYAVQAGIKLGIEPLHPMFAADRSVIVSLSQANGIVEFFQSNDLGVVIDVYHVWWDPAIYTEIARASGHIFGFHVNDWIVPVPDMLNGRGMMGDGIIEIRRLREAVTQAGYRGPVEIEIFNEDLWRWPGRDLLRLAKDRFVAYV